MNRARKQIRYLPGFTLVEVIVVAILLSFAALAVVPSLRANPSAKFQLASDQVMDLLSVYASGDRTGNAPVALQRQLDFEGMEVISDRLALLVQDETDGVTEWRIDPHVRPVELIEAISRDGIDVRLDGELIDAEGEPVAHSARRRPTRHLGFAASGGPATDRNDPTEPVVYRPKPRRPSRSHGRN